MVRTTLIILILFWTIFDGPAAISQSITQKALVEKEALLSELADSMAKAVVPANRNMALAAFNPTIMDLLESPETFSYPFDSVKTLSKLMSPDKKVRIYTWAFRSLEDGTYTYYGIIQTKMKDSETVKITGLKELKQPNEEVVTKELQPDEWYGAVYYDLIQKKVKKNTYYYLLGWQGNDRFTTRKVIEVLFYDSWNRPVFGSPVFKDNKNKTLHRVVFEFTAEAVMTLRYETKKKMIVFDHLSPASPSTKGQYRFYGPDFTYDGYKFKKGYWNYKSNLEMRNSR